MIDAIISRISGAGLGVFEGLTRTPGRCNGATDAIAPKTYLCATYILHYAGVVEQYAAVTITTTNSSPQNGYRQATRYNTSF